MERILSVTQLNDYVAGMMAHDPILRSIRLRGELSGVRRTATGHCYFTMKDECSLVRCVMFHSQAQGAVDLAEGLRVVVKGYVSLYTREGQFQLYVQEIQAEGAGDFFLRFEELKADLLAQGYFAPERKRPLPVFPRRIGIVTSQMGAVVHDIARVVRRRCPFVPLLLAPSAVQGDGSGAQIVSALNKLNQIDDVDVIILARGGGSMEDLGPFNSREVAKAIYESQKPVVSAVGHETDFTIADFVADVRAATPSVAAELVTPSRIALKQEMAERIKAGAAALEGMIAKERWTLKLLRKSAVLAQPQKRLQTMRERLDYLGDRLFLARRQMFAQKHARLRYVWNRLENHSPQHILRLGYTLLQRRIEENRVCVTSATQLHIGERVEIQLCDGRVAAMVQDIDRSKSYEEI